MEHRFFWVGKTILYDTTVEDLAKFIECPPLRMNLNVNCGLWVREWCAAVGSWVVTSVPLWCRMVMIWERCTCMGEKGHGNSVLPT